MLRSRLLLTILLLAAMVIRPDSVAAAASFPGAPDADPASALQLLKSRCWSCHNAQKRESGLRLDLREQLLSGGDSGPAAVPGDSRSSRLIARVTSTNPDDRMPPEGPALTSSETELLAAWIDAGADWPAGAEASAAPRHWSWQPLAPLVPNKSVAATAEAHEIDLFIRDRLQQAGLSPALPASRQTLIRRASLDLTGLLPTPAEVDAFVADEAPGAWERVVDRLLASPHFGERWGRHWLDRARYADSDGYEKDNARPDAWRWRDWVIDAFNSDMPFDQFTIEQLAGDLLPNATPMQRLATAFHRQTLTNTEGGTDQEEFRVEACFDRTETTGAVWLGLTVGCARCHSHKYDPLSQREYYQLFAVFNNADETTTVVPLPNADVQAWPERQSKYEAELRALQGRLEELRRPLLPQFDTWLAEQQASNASQPAASTPDDVRKALAAGNSRSAAQTTLLLDFWSRTQLPLKSLYSEIDTHKKSAPQKPEITVRVLAARTQNLRNTFVLRRGEFLEPLKELAVQPAAPSILPPLPSRIPGQPPDRLDFARWLVSPENPIVPRVAVNHIWARLFGLGLVRTAGDFGVRGEQPSHPELLDWLAARFAGRLQPQPRWPQLTPWSQKQLIRLILTSATYQQSSAQNSVGQHTDPLNRLLWRQNRLRVEGEIVRDISLQVAGLLTEKIGGPSVFPPLPTGVAELSYANNFRWTESTGEDRYRRGLYTFFKRTAPHPSLTTFDCPDANTTCIERSLSNTPLQALVTLNNEVFSESARGLARRLLTLPSSDTKQQLREGFRICTSRNPSDEELLQLQSLLADFDTEYQQDPAAAAKLSQPPAATASTAPAASAEASDTAAISRQAALTAVCRVLLNLDEFITRE
ncbi:MAG: PSD1 and planctomycete cytochrome C domain-containing protein [Planctomycetaceae bacterium]